jgi:hypothetical protein
LVLILNEWTMRELVRELGEGRAWQSFFGYQLKHI